MEEQIIIQWPNEKVEEQITIQWPNEKGKRENNDPQSTSRKNNN